jgi:hypothetical protein
MCLPMWSVFYDPAEDLIACMYMDISVPVYRHACVPVL